MRLYVVIFTLVAVVGLFVDQYLNQRRHKGALIALAIILVPLAAFETAWSLNEHKLTSAAREYTGNPKVSVHCQRFTEAFGDVNQYKGYVKYNSDYTPTTVAQLDDDICRNLRSWLWSDKENPNIDQIEALHILTHESQHLKGEINEAKAECSAVQADASVAQLLGATPEQAQALAERYYLEIYPRLPSKYSDARCREYGELDQSPADGIWP